MESNKRKHMGESSKAAKKRRKRIEDFEGLLDPNANESDLDLRVTDGLLGTVPIPPISTLTKKKDNVLLSSIADYLKGCGFAKISEELLSQAQIKEEDLNKTIPDIEEIFCNFLSKEPKDEPSLPRDDEKERRSEMAEGEDAKKLLESDRYYKVDELTLAKLLSSTNNTDLCCSWATTRPDIIPIHEEQEEDDCWAYALSRGQNTAVLLSGRERPLLTPMMLKDGVSRRYQNDTRGLRHILHAREFMVGGKYVDDMIVHRQPAEDDPGFESLIETLLIKDPVAVCFELLPSYVSSYEGIGVYIPTKLDIRRSACERFPQLCAIQCWKFLDSLGRDWGEFGFGYLARHKGIIKQVIEFKVNSGYDGCVVRGDSSESGDDILPAATSESDDVQIYSKFIQDVPSDDSDFEGVIEPAKVFISNVHLKANKKDVMKFFEETPVAKVCFKKRKKPTTGEKKDTKSKTGIVTLKSRRDTKKALMRNGELMHLGGERETNPYHLYVSPCTNNAVTIFVSGFDVNSGKNEIKNQLNAIFQCYSKKIKIFLPEDQRFAYLYMVLRISKEDKFEKAVKKGSIKWNNVTIIVQEAKMKKEFMKGWLSKKEKKRKNVR